MVEISGQELKQFKQLAAAVNSTLDGIAFTDLEANLIYANRAFAEMHGYPAADLLGKHIYLFHNDQQKPQVDAAISQVKATGKFSGIIWRVHRNGAIFPSRMSISIFKDSKGLALGIIAVVRDVTEQQRADDEARKAKESLEQIFDAIPFAILIIGPDKRIRRLNKVALRLAGYANEAELVGHVCHDTLCPAEVGHCPIYDLHSAIDRSEKCLIAKGGKHVPVLKTAAPFVYNGEKVLLESFVDITERKQAEEEQRVANAYNRSLIEASLDPLVTISPEGKIADVNSATETITGCSRGELIGKEFSDYFTEPDKARAGYREVLEKGMVRDYALEIRHKNGRATPVLYNATPYRDEAGRVIGVFASARDITERKKAAEELLTLKNKYDAILKAVPNIIMEVDANKVYTWANETGKMFFGPEVVGREAAAYFVGEQATYQVVDPLFSGSEDVIYVESWQKRRDGELRLLGWWCRTLKDANGKVTGALSSARDITDQKKAEEALLQAMKELKLVNDVAVGNELKMIEREKEVNGLLKELGRGPKYK